MFPTIAICQCLAITPCPFLKKSTFVCAIVEHSFDVGLSVVMVTSGNSDGYKR